MKKALKMTSQRAKKAVKKYVSVRFPKLLIENVYFFDQWESDLLEVTKLNHFIEYELKVSRSDYLADADKKMKFWTLENGLYCPNQFYYICPEGVIQKDDLPNFAGLIWIDERNFCRVIQSAPIIHENRVAPELWERLATTIYKKYVI